MFTRTKSTPTDERANPFRDPLFRPLMSSLPTPDFRRKVQMILDQYLSASSSTTAASEEVSAGNPHLPSGGEPMDILQVDSAGKPQWLRKLTVSDRSPLDSEGDEEDLWFEVTES